MTGLIVAFTFAAALIGAGAVLHSTISEEWERILAALAGEGPTRRPRTNVVRFTPPAAPRPLAEWRAAA
jgi:hypothetical protein